MKIYLTIITLLTTIILGQDSTRNEFFDPSILIEPEPNWPIIINPVVQDSMAIKLILGSDNSPSQKTGYRIQVLSTELSSKADSLQSILARIVTDSVYIAYEVPNYKVRVGDFINRYEAEELQKEIIKLGYRSAWIIRTRVDVNQEKRTKY